MSGPHPGKYLIITRDGGTVSVPRRSSTDIHTAPLTLNREVNIWHVIHAPDGAFLLILHGYTKTGVEGDTVVVSQKEDFRVVAWRLASWDSNKYIISPIEQDELGWTVVEGGDQPRIGVRPLGINPPVFEFVRVPE